MNIRALQIVTKHLQSIKTCGYYGIKNNINHQQLNNNKGLNSKSFNKYGALIEKFVPKKYDAYLKLGRYDKPIGYQLLFWPCAWGICLGMPGFNVLQLTHMMATFYFGSVVMRAAGCIINDMWDHEFDKKVERTKTRPLASGQLNFTQASYFLAMHLSGGLLVLTQLNWYSIALAFGIMPIVAIYPFMKRVTYYPQFVLGLAFNWGILVGYAALNGVLNSTIAFPAYLAGIAWTLIYDTIYAHQDKKDDIQIGVKSTALAWGNKTKDVTTYLNGLAFLLLSISGYTSGYNALYYAGLVAAHSYQQYLIQNFNYDNPSSCGYTFVQSKNYGILVMLSILTGQYFKSLKEETDKNQGNSIKSSGKQSDSQTKH